VKSDKTSAKNTRKVGDLIIAVEIYDNTKAAVDLCLLWQSL